MKLGKIGKGNSLCVAVVKEIHSSLWGGGREGGRVEWEGMGGGRVEWEGMGGGRVEWEGKGGWRGGYGRGRR